MIPTQLSGDSGQLTHKNQMSIYRNQMKQLRYQMLVAGFSAFETHLLC